MRSDKAYYRNPPDRSRALLVEWISRAAFSTGLTATFRQISQNRSTTPRVMILNYHSVGNAPFVPEHAHLCTAPKVFARHIQYVSRHYRVVGLDELVGLIRSGDVTEDMLAITLDDGYRDNRTHALPVLQRYGTPATVFLATDYIETGQALPLIRLYYWFHLAQPTSKELHSLARRLGLMEVLETQDANALVLTEAARQMIKRLPRDQAERVLNEIALEFGCKQARPPSETLEMLTWDEVRIMRDAGISFGSHGASHTVATCLSPEAFHSELLDSKRAIHRELGVEITGFAYPTGKLGDFNEVTREIVQQVGLRYACIFLGGVNFLPVNVFALDRLAAGAVSLPVLAAQLSGLLPFLLGLWHRLAVIGHHRDRTSLNALE